jgi:prepilin-type N-terminal cleavage/methylation domain-containing protein
MRGHQLGFTLLEVLVVLAIVLVLASVSIPNIQRSRAVANETATVELLTALNNQCFLYWTQHDGYPRHLAELWPEIASGTIDDDQNLSLATKAGYVFTYRPGPVNSNGRVMSYSVTATLVSPGVSGVRSFFADESGPIRAHENGEATADSPSIY